MNYDTVSQGGGKFFRELDAPQLPPGQAPPRKGSCPGGRPPGPAAAAGYFTAFDSNFFYLIAFNSFVEILKLEEKNYI